MTREHHLKAFEVATIAWRKVIAQSLMIGSILLKEASEKAENLSIRAEEVKIPELSWSPRPENHENDYNNAIARFSMSLDDDIWLSHQDFNQLVMDNWSWRRSFEQSATRYLEIGSSKESRELFKAPQLTSEFLAE